MRFSVRLIVFHGAQPSVAFDAGDNAHDVFRRVVVVEQHGFDVRHIPHAPPFVLDRGVGRPRWLGNSGISLPPRVEELS